MKAFGLYAASCVVIVALLGAIAWGFVGTDARSAILMSAALAVGIQLVSFMVARLLQPRHLMLGWGLGSMLRLLALVVYAFIVAKVWRTSLAPALLSFVGFLFVTTVVEPIFLKYR